MCLNSGQPPTKFNTHQKLWFSLFLFPLLTVMLCNEVRYTPRPAVGSQQYSMFPIEWLCTCGGRSIRLKNRGFAYIGPPYCCFYCPPSCRQTGLPILFLFSFSPFFFFSFLFPSFFSFLSTSRVIGFLCQQ